MEVVAGSRAVCILERDVWEVRREKSLNIHSIRVGGVATLSVSNVTRQLEPVDI
jgi:hypothetical protein